MSSARGRSRSRGRGRGRSRARGPHSVPPLLDSSTSPPPPLCGSCASPKPPQHRLGAKQRALQQAKSDAAARVGDRAEHGRDLDQHLDRIFLKNKFSALDATTMAHKASKAGAVGVEKTASIFARSPKNLARDLLHACLTKRGGRKWPEFYWAKIPVCNPKTGVKKELAWIPFLLMQDMLDGHGLDRHA